MITSIKGTVRLDPETEDRVFLETNNIEYEVIVPPYVYRELARSDAEGGQRLLHIHHYLEGGIGTGSLIPRLVGFLERDDKALFLKLITVPSLGVKKVCKSLVIPVKEVAQAIEECDTRKLSSLPEIGARTAEKIIVQLKGKLPRFVPVKQNKEQTRSVLADDYITDCVGMLVQLGYRRSAAEEIVAEAHRQNPEIKDAASLFRETLKSLK